jgi:hypothetical protein
LVDDIPQGLGHLGVGHQPASGHGQGIYAPPFPAPIGSAGSLDLSQQNLIRVDHNPARTTQSKVRSRVFRPLISLVNGGCWKGKSSLALISLLFISRRFEGC